MTGHESAAGPGKVAVGWLAGGWGVKGLRVGISKTSPLRRQLDATVASRCEVLPRPFTSL